MKIPDRMGAWDEDGEVVYLPKVHYPNRHNARKFMMDECGLQFIEIRVLARYMKYEPREYANGKFVDGIWIELDPIIEDWWVECDPSDEGAFPVWKCL